MDYFLEGIEKKLLEEEMRSYVAELSPHSAEFVRETEPHTVDRLLRDTEW